jgi:hypothetical protein
MIPAAHRMKDFYRIISDGMIEYFNRISRPVEANEPPRRKRRGIL